MLNIDYFTLIQTASSFLVNLILQLLFQLKIKSVQFKSYRRFTDFTIEDIPESAKLVVLVGPNGSGKSSVFDGFRSWLGMYGTGSYADADYHYKGESPLELHDRIAIHFHNGGYPYQGDKYILNKKAFYIRTAYRNEADFTVKDLKQLSPPEETPRIGRLIENDASVEENYQRLASTTIRDLFKGKLDAMNGKQITDYFLGQVRGSMSRVFEDLELTHIGDPISKGTFYFRKGSSQDFHFKNLSAGEKAAFDLILDIVIKKNTFQDTVYCIDEPEAHMHTRLQARLLEELVTLIPGESQLWIASHSIGMMRKAKELQEHNPGEVVFVDFGGLNFDGEVKINPRHVDREFWANTLKVALDDFAALIAPKTVVFCEGKYASGKSSDKTAFDAKCYQTIFRTDFPDTDFVSVGSAKDIESDRLQFVKTMQTLVSGTEVIRLIDKDDRSQQEIDELRQNGVRVLGRRTIESYLLDDEVLGALCIAKGAPEKLDQVLEAKQAAITDSLSRGNQIDDMKSASGLLYTTLKKILPIHGGGNDNYAFMRVTLAPLIIPTMRVYKELKRDIFG